MKFTIEQSSDNNEVEINIKCGQIIDEKLQKLIDQIRLYSFSIVCKKDKEIYQISLKDAYYIESVEEKTFVYLEKEVYESNLKLYELEEQLKNTSYIRVSKSIILNIEKLQSVKPLINGKLEANLKNNEKILINRHYVPEFKKKFGIYEVVVMKLRESIVISCVSYTAVMIIISILNGMGVTGLSWKFNLELFLVTTLISLFMYIIDKLNIESQPVYMILQILSVAISVLGIGGGVMKWFSWTLEYVSITTGVFVVVYFITYGVVFLINSITTEKINQKIAEHNNKEN